MRTLHLPDQVRLEQLGSCAVIAFSNLTASVANCCAELAYQLKDTGAQLLLAHPSLLRTAIDAAKDAGLSKEQVFQFSDKEEAAYDGVLDWRRILASEEEARGYTWPELSEEEATKTVATINYSSGTTGLPKGVCISHHNIISNVEQSTYMVQRKSQDARRWIGLLPLYHAYGQLYTCLIAPKLGIPVFIMQSFTFEDMLWTIATHRITNLHVAPPIMVLFAKRPEVANYDLSSLTEVASGAAPLSRDLQREVSKRLGVRVQQGWGMTEITCAGILTPGDSTDEYGWHIHFLLPTAISFHLDPVPSACSFPTLRAKSSTTRATKSGKANRASSSFAAPMFVWSTGGTKPPPGRLRA